MISGNHVLDTVAEAADLLAGGAAAVRDDEDFDRSCDSTSEFEVPVIGDEAIGFVCFNNYTDFDGSRVWEPQVVFRRDRVLDRVAIAPEFEAIGLGDGEIAAFDV